jgi:hypothetical protein
VLSYPRHRAAKESFGRSGQRRKDGVAGVLTIRGTHCTVSNELSQYFYARSRIRPEPNSLLYMSRTAKILMRKVSEEHGLIAILDALGASSYGPDEIDRFLNARELVLDRLGEMTEEIVSITPSDLITFTFNDTIIFVLRCGEIAPTLKRTATFAAIIRKFMVDSMENGMLFRGSIALGRFVWIRKRIQSWVLQSPTQLNGTRRATGSGFISHLVRTWNYKECSNPVKTRRLGHSFRMMFLFEIEIP